MKLILGIAVLVFFSLLLFGSGVFLQSIPSQPVQAGRETGKSAAHSTHSKNKPVAKAAPKAALPGTSTVKPLAFPLTVAGGIGLLLSAVAALALSHSLRAPTPEASRRLRETERAARQKQQEEYEARQTALQSQLLEARQRKAETEALRDQVSRQFQEFFRTLPVPCFCFAATGKIIRWNAACEALYGIPAAAALESTLWDTIVPVSEREGTEAKISRVLAGESLLGSERWDTVAGGGQAPLRCSMVPLYDADGLIIGGLSAGVDVTEFAAVQQQIAALTLQLEAVTTAQEHADLDRETPKQDSSDSIAAAVSIEGALELSGHPAFRARLTEEIDRAARYHAPLSLILLDLDNFAARNRTFGFEAGDQALAAAVAVIKSKIRTVDVLARLGADEYAIILPETGEVGARVAADRLRTGLLGATPAGQPPLSACLGAALLTPEISGAAALVAHAQDALTAAQSCGAGTAAHYQDVAARPLPASRSASGNDIPTPARPRRVSAKTAKTEAANVESAKA